MVIYPVVPGMRLNRRTVLMGLGAVGVGTGGVFSSGAFSQIEADRQVEINLTDDASGIIGLVANSTLDGISNTGSAQNNQLEVSLSDVNVNSTVEFGNMADPESTEGFMIDNNTGASTSGFDVDITLDAQHIENNSSASVTVEMAYEDSGGTVQVDTTTTNAFTVAQGASKAVALRFDMTGTNDPTNKVNGQMTVTANRV